MTAVAIAAALAVPLLGVKPAEATPTPNGCKSTTTGAAEMGHYPAQPASQSGLRISCVFNNQPGTSQVAASFTIHDFDVAQYHNGAARTVTNVGAMVLGATTFTATSCTGMTTWVNRPITTVGVAGLPARSFILSVSGACLVTLSNATTAAIAAGTSWKIDNTIGRSRTDVATTLGSGTVTSATANFTAADTGLSVSGTDIPANTTATFVNATTITLTPAANVATATALGSTVTFGGTLLNTTTRMARDDAGTLTAATDRLVSTIPRFTSDDLGLQVRVTGTGVVNNNAVIITVVNATTVVLGCAGGGCVDPITANFTATAATPLIAQIGDPSATAPISTDTIANQGVQLDLNPALVAGSENCSAEDPEGFSTVAKFNNPGSFAGSALFNTQPANTKSLGQIYFDTSVTDFSAFVIERRVLTAGDPIGTVHYDVVVPNAPTTLAMCPGTATSPGLGFSLGVHAQTLSGATNAQGTGKPGSGQFRSILPSATGTYSASVFIDSQTAGVTYAPASEFNRLCIYSAVPATVAFTCGNG